MNKNCPVCDSNSKDVRNGLSVCKKCGNVYVPADEIPREYPPKVSTTLEDTHMVENSRLLAELIFNFFLNNQAIKNQVPITINSIQPMAVDLTKYIQSRFEMKKKGKS